MSMTWGEFKAFVEEAGVTNDMEIWYMDFSFPDPDTLDVHPQTWPEDDEGNAHSSDLGVTVQ